MPAPSSRSSIPRAARGATPALRSTTSASIVGATLGPLVAGPLAQLLWLAGRLHGRRRSAWQPGWCNSCGDAGCSATAGLHTDVTAAATPRIGTASPRSALRCARARRRARRSCWWRCCGPACCHSRRCAARLDHTGLIAPWRSLYFAYLLFAAGLDALERQRLLAVVVLFVASVLFWAGYEQTGSSLNLSPSAIPTVHLFGYDGPGQLVPVAQPGLHRDRSDRCSRRSGWRSRAAVSTRRAAEVHPRPARHGRGLRRDGGGRAAGGRRPRGRHGLAEHHLPAAHLGRAVP